MNGRQIESDFPAGHPARADYDPASAEAQEWARKYVHPRGERDFPVDHPKAGDTPGNLNIVAVRAGVDPLNAHLEPFTGRTPAQAAAVRELSARATAFAKESPVMPAIDATEAASRLNKLRQKFGREVLTEQEVRDGMAAYYAELQARRTPAQPE